MKIIECEFYDGSLGLVNITDMRYCYLITKDGYGRQVDEIRICFDDDEGLTLNNGRKTYEIIKRIKEHE